MNKADIVIVGGGCAGLSLARDVITLSGYSSHVPKIVIIEPREVYHNDRTWCFWSPTSTRHDHIISRRWNRWSFGTNQARHVHHAPGGWSYSMVAAIDFYIDALDKIWGSDNVSLHMDTHAKSITVHNDCAIVETDKGSWQAAQVIDTRPPASGKNNSTLWQRFIGAEVELAQPMLNITTAGLMNNMGHDRFGFHFDYVLPIAHDRWLVEATRFTDQELDSAQMERDLQRTLSSCIPSGQYQILRTEQGHLPMGMRPANKLNNWRWINAGIAGGALRPSTGYAFQRIQQWSHYNARRIIDGVPVQPQSPLSVELRMMDSVFLNVIKARPAAAPDYFMALAEKVEPAALVRFLNNTPAYRDLYAIMRALPATPFMREALNHTGFALQGLIGQRSS